jgi:hypothetical protein
MAQIQNSKKIFLWGFTLLFPILLLGIIEIGFRVAGYNSEAQELFIEAGNDADFYITNTNFVERYFPDFAPRIAPGAIRKVKKPNTFRIFVFGGSSAQGFPYNFYNSFADQLEQKLLLNTNGLNIEIANLGMTAVNSYVIRDLSKRVLPYEPDAIIIYAGHNEFYGSFGAGSTQFGMVNNVSLKRFTLWLKNFRFYQFLENLIQTKQESTDRRTLMAKVVNNSDIAKDSKTFKQGMHQFEENITDVVELFARRDIPVLVGTVVSNLKDQAPFTDNPAANAMYKEGVELFDAGNLDAARAKFIAAKELDGIRFRAPEGINEIIRDITSTDDAILVDIEKAIREQAPSGIEDDFIFVDHLHPNFKTHLFIANLFLAELIEFEMIEMAIAPNLFGVPARVSAFEETYAGVAISRLKVGYPFQKGLTQEEELQRFTSIYNSYLKSSYIDSLAANAAQNQVHVPKVLTEIVNYAKGQQDTLAVMSHYYELLKWQLNSQNLIEKGIEYSVTNRATDVYLVNMILQVLNDGSYEPRYMDVLSSIYLMYQKLDKAKYWLDESERLNSNSPRLFYNFARYHILAGDTLQAQNYFLKYQQSLNN